MSLIDQVFDAGVVGAGGAGFPTHKKLVDGLRLLVVNAAECEPLLASDRYVMRHHAAQVVDGIARVAAACQVPRVVIGTKSHYTEEITALREAIAAAGADIEIHATTSFYPAGDEQVLIYEITGETVPPGGIPAALGIAVINVTTAYNIAAAAQGAPVTRHYVTVTGEVARPCIVDAPVGATAADLIAAAGGPLVEPYAIVRGGPMMGRHHAGSEAGDLGYGKADGGLIVLPADHPLIVFNQQPIERLLNQTHSACIQCRMCTDMCPRFLIGHSMRPHRVMRAIETGVVDEALSDALLCCECGICELFACPMGLSPRKMNIYAKGFLRAKGVQPDKEIHLGQTVDRPHRRIAQSRLIDRWKLSGYPTHLDDLVRIDPARVVIATRHGVGAPSAPCVAVGDHVTAGQLIADVPDGALGARVHSSIDGRVTSADDARIIIEA